ncbi:type 1 glutamine amidotransferase domain-containing protein [uncultured Sunxiuqinia sp.]|uniref:type 1 glutamine amidotransferase domain-containing protein n=1 Tax=uncultured Sunxiuqinia sp. TaxID=1573825 RepID=UPI002AA70D3E|nr:type 1 glutamine amidotransferase domain-containing protein [uncultured Sunxiuqinia sp.]
MGTLTGKKVAILATNGFEESELFGPKDAFEKSGADVLLISPESGKITAWKHGEWSRKIDVDVNISEAEVSDYDALMLPGGVINPDKLRRNEKAVSFVRDFMETGKPVAAICHGPQMLIEADAVKGRTMTSFFSIKKDLQNAGANWIDLEVVVDNGLVTSRNPSDLESFSSKMVEEIAEGNH